MPQAEIQGIEGAFECGASCLHKALLPKAQSAYKLGADLFWEFFGFFWELFSFFVRASKMSYFTEFSRKFDILH